MIVHIHTLCCPQEGGRQPHPANRRQVCVPMLTDGVADEKVSAGIVSAKDYIPGAMALGASLQGNIYPERTRQLLLLREGFLLDPDDI